MLKSFAQFINESREPLDFLSDLTTKLIQKIRTLSKKEQKYTLFSGMEFREPFEFDLKVYLRKDATPDIENDEHFSYNIDNDVVCFD
jgi:hypothetical protein